MSQYEPYRDTRIFASDASRMASSGFSDEADREAWARMLRVDLARYYTAMKNGFIWREDSLYKPYEPSLADSAYEIRCELLGLPFITIWQARGEGGARGIEIDFRLPEKDKQQLYLSETGLWEFLAFFEQEKRICHKSKGYTWLLGTYSMGVKHSPKSRIPHLLKGLHRIADNYTITDKQEHYRAMKKVLLEIGHGQAPTQ